MMIALRLFLIIATIFCGVEAAFAEQDFSTNNQAIITKIKSDFIDIKRKNRIVNLNGNVTVERQDVSIKADNMLLYYKDKDDQNGVIEKIDAKNNVKIFNGEFIATGKYGFYNADKNNVILEKDVIFNNGTSIASGEKFIYDLKTKKANLLGAKQDSQPAIESNSESSFRSNSKEDNRVMVIIDDDDIKKNKLKN